VSRIDFAALREDRRPVFPGGLAVLAGVFDALQIDQMETSERALREGLIYDLLGRLSDHDVRDEAVAQIGQRFSVDSQQAERVAGTALALFEMAREDWALDARLAAPLRWAAALHEIGLSVAHSGFHKHGEYILRNADLQGFSQTDQKVLAALVRLHRGKFSTPALDQLPSLSVEPVRRLAYLLRIAAVLHRGRQPHDLLAPRLHVRARSIELSFDAEWHAQHPLTLADLEAEAQQLQTVGMRLIVH